jgi:hypothetical protein
MIRRINSEDLANIDLIPQAIIAKPPSVFAARFGEFAEAYDDLDYYEGAAFKVDGQPFAMRRYRGVPDKDTTTIYFPDHIKDVNMITNLISKIIEELRLQPKDLQWQRADNPDL